MTNGVAFVDLPRLHADVRSELLGSFARVLDSGIYVMGEEVRRLESACEAAFESEYALAVSSGTAALQLALLACEVGPGDEVITVANSFISGAEAISAVGATPVFAEIEADGFNIDVRDAGRRITPRTRAIIVPHLYGEIADIARVLALARRRGLRVIEDACRAHGARWEGRQAGTFGDAGCLSFHPTRNLGAVGEGGMVLTGDPAIAAAVLRLRDHGQAERYLHREPGYNFRMSELQAASLRVLLPRLGDWNERRAAVAARYRATLPEGVVALPPQTEPGRHVYESFVVRSDHRDALKQFLDVRGIGSAIHYPVPLHLQPAYRIQGRGPGSLPRTETAVAEILSLPMHPLLRADEVEQVCVAIEAFGLAREPARQASNSG